MAISIERDELVAVPLNDETDELLGDLEVGLHGEEVVECVRAGHVRAVRSVSRLCERVLRRPGSAEVVHSRR